VPSSIGCRWPYSPPGAANFPNDLYQLCRNPLAHAAGLINAPAPIVAFTRIFDAAHVGIGWNDAELNDLERRAEQHGLHPGIVPGAQQWTLHCDSFYLDVINLMRRLMANAAQMRAVEQRLSQSVYNWRY